jgi:hypothetical protein
LPSPLDGLRRAAFVPGSLDVGLIYQICEGTVRR